MADVTKNGVPAFSFLIVENKFKPVTWQMQVMDAGGKPDHKLMGATMAALSKYEGSGKADAMAKLKKMYNAEKMPIPAAKNFAVFKQANGLYRWVTFSSSAFTDRDGETISVKALEAAVDRLDATGEYGPLRWWHLGTWITPDGPEKWETWKAGPGVDLGTCDFQMLHGKMLIESGTFKTPEIGEAFSNVRDNLEVSITFSHPQDEPGASKEFENINIIERSLLTEGFASNMLTKFYVSKGDPTMKALDKLKALAAILKDKPELAAQILADSEAVQKAADAAGLSSKEVTEMFTVGEEVPAEEIPVTEIVPAAVPEQKELSVMDKVNAVQSAFRAAYPFPGMGEMPMEDPGSYVNEIYDTFLIVEKGGKNFQIDYSIDPDGTVKLSPPVAVTENWTPTGKVIASPKEKAAAAPAVPAPTPDKTPDEIGKMSRQQLADFCAAIFKQLNAPDPAASAKEVQQEQFISDMGVSVKSLSDRLAPIDEELTGIKKSLDELTGAQPVGVKQLLNLRPSASEKNITNDVPAGPTLAPSFVKFAQGGK